MTILALLAAAAAAAPTPSTLQTFADWTVGCDNGRVCQAVALAPEGQLDDDYLLLVVTRDAAPAATPRLRVPVPETMRGTLVLLVDGKPVRRIAATGKDVTLTFDRALATALANGKAIELTADDGKLSQRASLAGLAATFLYIDEAQRRLGTTTALRSVGTRAVATIPPVPALPVIRRPAASPKPPRGMTVAAAARAIGRDNAVCDYARGPVKPEAYRLDAAHSVVAIDHPCGNGAYNMFSSVFVVDEAGRAVPARFDANASMGPDESNIVVNGGWDPATRTLSSFAKGRGLADCGSSQSFAWDGARFRLIEQTMMGECRGSRDYIRTWRAVAR